MRVFGVISLALILLFSPWMVMVQGSAPSQPELIETMAGEDFTHAVLAEDITATWCQYCPAADAQLTDIYYHDGYDRNFFWVALITDVNDKAMDRKDDYPDVTGYPTVVFDGGENKVAGQQSDKSSYEDAIEDSGDRDDTDISVRIAMNYEGGYNISAKLWVTWNEDGTLLNPTFNAYVRAYIVEPHSRYLNHDGKNYGFGFLDYAFDQPIELDPHEETLFETSWSGTDYQDTNGDDFSDLVYDNLNVIASIFNDESSDTDAYNLAIAGAMPPIVEPDEMEGMVSGKVELTGQAWGNRSQLAELQYRLDGGEWSTPEKQELPLEGGEFSFELDTTDLEDGNHSVDVRLIDEFGTDNWKTVGLNVTNDDQPPAMSWVSPTAGVLSDEVAVQVTATDPQGLDHVEVQVDDGPFQTMDDTGNDTYSWTWNTATATDGQHTLTVRAADTLGNEDSLSQTFEVDNGGEPTLPAISLLEPTPEMQPLTGSVAIIVHATDPEGLDKVTYSYTGNEREHALIPRGNDEFTASWNTALADSGEVTLTLRAVDNDGSQNSLLKTFLVDNERPGLQVNLPDLIDGQAWGDQRIQVTATDAQGAVTVEYGIDTGVWQTMTLISAGQYETSWSTLGLEDAIYFLQVRAIDEAGNIALWSGSAEVVNQELTFSYASDDAPDAKDVVELIIPLEREFEAVTVLFTSPGGLPPLSAVWNGYGYTVRLPTDFDQDQEVQYHIVLDTAQGQLNGPTRSYRVTFQGQAGGGGGSNGDEMDLTLILGVTGAVVVLAAGGLFFFQRQREEEGLWEQGPAPVAATGLPAPGPSTAPPSVGPPAQPVAVACPHCQNHLSPPPGPRPMVVACTYCAGQFQVL